MTTRYANFIVVVTFLANILLTYFAFRDANSVPAGAVSFLPFFLWIFTLAIMYLGQVVNDLVAMNSLREKNTSDPDDDPPPGDELPDSEPRESGVFIYFQT